MCITETLCFDVNTMIVLGFFLLFLFGGLGYLAFRHFFPSDDGEGIQSVNMNFQRSVPEKEDGADAEETGVEEEEYQYRPFAVGTTFFGGVRGELGAKLEVTEYDDENSEIGFKLWVEAPAGSTNITIHHDMDTDYQLGTATIRYQLGSVSHTVLINMGSDDLEDLDYGIVINEYQSTNEDIKE